jgi:HK97 family phage prohead protease
MKNENIKHRSISDFQIKADGDELIVSGWGARYGNIDSYRDVLQFGCASKTISERKDRIAFCEQHNMTNPIGKFIVLEERPEGIYFEARISDAEPKIKTKIREGILKEFSIGYSEVNSAPGVQDSIEVNFVKEIKLYEISVVTVAANEEAKLIEIKAEDIATVQKAYDTIIEAEKDEAVKYQLLLLKKKALESIEPQTKALEDDKPQKNEIQILTFKI